MNANEGGIRAVDGRQRSEVTPVEHPGREPGSTGQGGRKTEDGERKDRGQPPAHRGLRPGGRSEIRSQRSDDGKAEVGDRGTEVRGHLN